MVGMRMERRGREVKRRERKRPPWFYNMDTPIDGSKLPLFDSCTSEIISRHCRRSRGKSTSLFFQPALTAHLLHVMSCRAGRIRSTSRRKVAAWLLECRREWSSEWFRIGDEYCARAYRICVFDRFFNVFSCSYIFVFLCFFWCGSDLWLCNCFYGCHHHHHRHHHH